jgi:hypothetical protein
MSAARNYAASGLLRDGRRIEIRAIRADDEAALTATVAALSAGSLHRRFFSVKRNFSEQEKAFFLNVDFVTHVALVAELKDGHDSRHDSSHDRTIIGGARYIVAAPETAEVAFARRYARAVSCMSRCGSLERPGPARGVHPAKAAG